MFNIGPTELILILGVALVIFGPGKLPELGETLGKAIREFKHAVNNIDDDIKREVNDIRQEVEEVKEAADVRAAMEEIQNDIKEAVKFDLTPAAKPEAAPAQAGETAEAQTVEPQMTEPQTTEAQAAEPPTPEAEPPEERQAENQPAAEGRETQEA